MTPDPTNPFDQALSQFHEDYAVFDSLLDSYPIDKQEEAGACGIWSPKQVVAHLSGWIIEATERYEKIAAGDTGNIFYDADPFNERSVTPRAQMNWSETVTEFREVTATLIKAATEIADKNDERYRAWLVGLAKEFRNHGADLRRFLQEDEMPYPILEFDDSPTAILEPTIINMPIDGMPERVVFCFFQEVITAVCGDGKARVIGHLNSEIARFPIYVLEHKGKSVAVAHPGVGGGLSGSFLEELIAKGGRKFIACGGAGSLEERVGLGYVIVPESAVRDEGTSYHYLPPGREVAADPQAVNAIKQVLSQHNIPYLVGKTWTTDAPYRETASKVQRRKAEGCLTVEMEAACFFAIAQFRKVQFGQLLYGGDDVSGETWVQRDWYLQASTREKLFWLAVESVLEI